MKRTLLAIALYACSINSYAYDENGDRLCLAQNIYFEAGNQSVAGKIAVANVVMNRVKMREYPNNVCDVIHQGPTRINWKGNELPVKHRCQFSWYCDGKPDVPVDSKTWNKSLRIAAGVLSGAIPDITEGSSHYHADFVDPDWAENLKLVTVIDNHLFYK